MPSRVHGWKQTTLGAVLHESNERAGEGTSLPVLSVTKTRGPMLASERFGKTLHARNLSKYRVARRGMVVADPMLLWDGSIGIQNVVPAGVVSPDYRVYTPASDTDPNFLGFLLRWSAMVNKYGSGARGTNVRRNRISRGDFERIGVQLPPLSEQRRIATILASVNEAITQCEVVSKAAEMLSKALILELMTKGVPGRHTSFKKTDIGDMPENWEVGPLDRWLEGIDAGWSPQCEAAPASAGEWGVLKVSAVTWGTFAPTENKRLPTTLQPRPELAVRPGDVLVSRANTPELVGRAVFVEHCPARLMLSDKLLRLRPAAGVLPAYLNLALATPASRKQIEKSASGTSRSMRNISQEKLRAVTIPIPSIAEQEDISMSITRHEQARRANEVVVERLREIKAGLLNDLLSGRLRVPTPETEAA